MLDTIPEKRVFLHLPKKINIDNKRKLCSYNDRWRFDIIFNDGFISSTQIYFSCLKLL